MGGDNGNASSSSMFLNASVPIVKQAGPSLKHSVTAQIRQNGTHLDHAQLPTQGTDWNLESEWALPVYSDVSFWKFQGNWACHVAPTILGGLAWHGLFKGGYLHAFSAAQRPTVSDRFYVGGPLNFRGFLPAGIGPRATKGGGGASSSSHHTTDALGGDFFYTATLMASLPLGSGSTEDASTPPPTGQEEPTLSDILSSIPLRAFAFGTVGTCVGNLAHVAQQNGGDVVSTATAVWQSSRASVGVGIATNVLGNNRLEFTYAVPLRYGPLDHRRNVQIGMSLHLDQ
mmetsp:Transcript_4721/g.10066  ORF Transcript_4721/g.10066 Transcript_4721/m.10066 type:complete len:286 (-) Transcript_4721:19-876(-)